VTDCSCEGWPHFYLCPRYKPSSLRRGSGLRAESTKQAQRRRTLSALRKQMVEGGATQCVVQWPDICTGAHQGWHHLKKKSAGGGDDMSNLVLSCNACNGAIEDNPLEARERGWVHRD
jgi:5-methylcytosine-specific restriction endonuclease McrA